MSKKASPALIGGFVIGAVALLVIGTSSTSKARSRACALGPTSTCAASASAR
jgi:hypothetical protein